jgi:citrate/tricarballylate utilization protein
VSAHSRVSQARIDARRDFDICNACRYCEGFCAVFPAMMQRRSFDDADLNYLANLCHNCQGCYHACQYAPPHPFGVNLPKALAELRTETYQKYAWPGPFARLYERGGAVVAVAVALAVAAILILTSLLRGTAVLSTAYTGPGAFYAVIPWDVMVGLFGASALYVLLALAIGAVRFWRDAGGRTVLKGSAMAQALHDTLTLRYLGGGHAGKDGCNDIDEGFSQTRRRLHHCVFYGFMLCFAATCVATVYDHFLHWPAPYPVLSLPVLLGLVGGLGLVVGSAGLIWVKISADPAPQARSVLGADYALLFLLLLTAGAGLAELALRDTRAMPVLLAVHLGLVLALFLTTPYSKMVHALYRPLALLRFALEKDVKPTSE